MVLNFSYHCTLWSYFLKIDLTAFCYLYYMENVFLPDMCYFLYMTLPIILPLGRSFLSWVYHLIYYNLFKLTKGQYHAMFYWLENIQVFADVIGSWYVLYNEFHSLIKLFSCQKLIVLASCNGYFLLIQLIIISIFLDLTYYASGWPDRICGETWICFWCSVGRRSFKWWGNLWAWSKPDIKVNWLLSCGCLGFLLIVVQI